MATEIAKAKPVVTLGSKPGDPAYLKIRDLIYQTSGIYHSEEKLYLLVSRCGRRMIALGAGSPSQYLEYLTTSTNHHAELRLLLNEITIGETYMFRHPAHLDALRNTILPQTLQTKGFVGLKRLRFWCAGCSTGEEPYTLAMFLLEQKDKLLAGCTFEILATDLNDNSLEAARAGIFGEYALRNTSEALRRKYFTDAGDRKLQANDLLRSQIRFDRVNLSDDGKMLFQKGIDVIFCCNVLIYFDVASKRRVVQHFYSDLVSGGYLFLGHAESLFQVDNSFRLIHFPGTTAYWKAAGPQAGGDKTGGNKTGDEKK
jgi:chemotaxis protein methyltransferase CheR